MARKKKNSEIIKSKVMELRRTYAGDNRQDWPHFAFHFSDANNVNSILSTGRMLSRNQIEKVGLDFVDTASDEVLANTSSDTKDLVRFYFRPLTPMFYGVEGFRPDPTKLKYPNAHCPIPIYLLFDNVDLLTEFDSGFSDGNLGSRYSTLYTSATDFPNLPFGDIYHEGSLYGDPRKSAILNHRHAEITIPSTCTLDHLSRIWCRSDAEKITLKNILPLQVWKKWRSAIEVQPEAFNRQWVYIESVVMWDEEMLIVFNRPRNPNDCGPFELSYELFDDLDNFVGQGILDTVNISSMWQEDDNNQIRLMNLPKESYGIKLYLNGDLAYFGKYFPVDDIPF